MDILLKLIFSYIVTATGSVAQEWQIMRNGKESCTRGCNLLRARMCGGVRCNEGVVTQELRNCNNPNPCKGALTQVKVNKVCTGACDRGLEVVTLSCSDPVACSVIETRYCQAPCSGTWSNWGDFGPCSVQCSGTKTRGRRCYDTRTGVQSTSCATSKGQHVQQETVSCNCKSSATLSTASNVGARPTAHSGVMGRNFPMSCISQCGQTSNEITQLDLINGCLKGIPLPENPCNVTTNYFLSCRGSAEEKIQSCTSPTATPFCMIHLAWRAWSDWVSDEKHGREHRFRHQWCNLPDPFINKTTCRREVRVQRECSQAKAHVGSEQLTGTRMPWVLILAIVLAIALFAIFIVACVCWRRKKKHKTQRKPASESLPQPPPSELQVFSGADAVFEEQPATDSNHLNVFQHLARVSEHLYDSISATGLRLFSRSSVGSHSHNDGELSARDRHSTENEYVDEGETSNKSGQNQQQARRFDQDNPLRISIMVTDPDGMEVNSSVYKAGRLETEGEATLTKKRWSRVPTPRKEKPEPQHFKKHGERNGNSHVPSVKYVSGTDAQELKPKKGKLGLRDFFKKLANSPTKEHQHDYDVVASDEVVDAANANKTRLYLPSASSQIGQFPQRDSVSAWSESTFDDDDLSSAPPHDSKESTPKERRGKSGRSKRSKRKSTATPKRERVTKADSKYGSLLSLNFPEPPADLLPTKLEKPSLEPEQRRKSDSAGSKNRSHFVFPATANQLTAQNYNTVGYLDMTINTGADEVNRRSRSGQASSHEMHGQTNASLKPNSSVTGSARYSSPRLNPVHAFSDLDEKYVSSLEVPRTQLSQGYKDFPTDSHGYIHLGLPE